MQPPQPENFLLRHAKQLERTREDTRSRTPPVKEPTPREIDYAEELRTWIESMPPANRSRRFVMDDFLTRFNGRYADTPAPRLIAEALRRVGFTERRDWSVAGRNRRYWLAPGIERL